MRVDDSCSGFKQTATDPNVFLAVAFSTVWTPTTVYDCPTGFHWASTEEGRQWSAAAVVTDAATTPLMHDSCGWDGLRWAGEERRSFRFADSLVTGAFKHAGLPESSLLINDDPENTAFAGIVCMRGEGITGDSRGNGSEVSCGSAPSQLHCRGRTGMELWESDGTLLGTRRVKDIEPGTGGSDPAYLVSMGDVLYFQVRQPFLIGMLCLFLFISCTCVSFILVRFRWSANGLGCSAFHHLLSLLWLCSECRLALLLSVLSSGAVMGQRLGQQW
jgi:ELWxxDGT repeat protein